MYEINEEPSVGVSTFLKLLGDLVGSLPAAASAEVRYCDVHGYIELLRELEGDIAEKAAIQAVLTLANDSGLVDTPEFIQWRKSAGLYYLHEFLGIRAIGSLKSEIDPVVN